jgi:hypothetical protein
MLSNWAERLSKPAGRAPGLHTDLAPEDACKQTHVPGQQVQPAQQQQQNAAMSAQHGLGTERYCEAAGSLQLAASYGISCRCCSADNSHTASGWC